MTQSSMIVGNVEASAARTAMNTALESLATLSTGTTAPASTFANMLWYDTTAGVLKKRTPANDDWETLITALGLKAMAELAIASQAEAEAGTATDKGMTPLRTAQAIAELSPASSPIKAWINFEPGAPPVFNASFNVTSITRYAAGDYGITFITAMEDANYAVVAMGKDDDASKGDYTLVSQTTTAVRIKNGVFNAYFAGDRGTVSVIVCR